MSADQNNKQEKENNLQEFIDGKAWSVAETARKADVSDKTIRKMLNKERTARKSKVKVAIAFSVNAKEIFPNDPEL